MLLCVVTACVEMNLLPVPWVRTFRLLDSSCIFRQKGRNAAAHFGIKKLSRKVD